HLAQDPAEMAVYLESPEQVKQGETFDLRVVVVNERKRQTLKVTSIDLAEDYLEGLSVRSCDPSPRGSTSAALRTGQSYAFGKSIPPVHTNVFTFHLRARKTGSFKGDVDVYEGMRVLTVMAETEVTK